MRAARARPRRPPAARPAGCVLSPGGRISWADYFTLPMPAESPSDSSAAEKPGRPGVVAEGEDVPRAGSAHALAQGAVRRKARYRLRSAPARSPQARRSRSRRRARGLPAAAPTASLAITARPRFIASFTTRPQGSRNVRVGIDGTTSTSQACIQLAQPGGLGGRQADHSGRGGGVARGPADHHELRIRGRGARQRPPGLQQHAQALLGYRPPDEQEPGAPGAGPRSAAASIPAARQNSLSTDCGATWTLCAPRARTYALTCGP